MRPPEVATVLRWLGSSATQDVVETWYLVNIVDFLFFV